MCFAALRPLSGSSCQFGLSFLQFFCTLLYRRNYTPIPSYGACINRRVLEFIARANLSDGETLNFARVFHVLPRDLCTFEISDFGCLDCSARIALDAVLRDFGRQSIALRGFIDAGLHETAYHV